MSLKEAKKYLSDNFKDGADCPCCGQFVKKYKRKLNASMARTLIAIYRVGGNWLHVKNHLRTLRLQNSHDWTLLKYWDLIEPCIGLREDGSKRNGYYRITSKGKLFVESKVSVEKYVFLFDGKFLGFGKDKLINIKDALGSKFNYDGLMAGQ